MELPRTVLVTDIGSTTTKALLFEYEDPGYRLVGSAHAPTTVEVPTEDVVVGLLEAVKTLTETTGRKLHDGGKLALGTGLDAFLSTSSAGGGLQILVSGLAKSVTAKSAFRAASAAGGVLLDVLAIDDGRMPHEKVEAIENLHPDMILIAGGIDGGDIANVVRMAAIIMAARLKPKFMPQGRMPVVFAGNVDARPQIESLLRDRAELMTVDNLRPTMDRENLDPTRQAIHELFTSHVMARAPGYSTVSSWTDLPLQPTPVAVEHMLEIISRHRRENIIMVDIGGATTDIFSFYEGTYSRTVSANLGMSYSASNILLEAGMENIMRWLTCDLSERQVRNIITNKCIHPARLPRDEVEIEVEQALAREALRQALRTHRDLTLRVRTVSVKDWTMAAFWSDRRFKPEFAEEKYIQMHNVHLLFGSGGVLSHAPERWQAALMMIDSLQPVGITALAVDSVFMTPHLGMLACLSEEAAYETFTSRCLVPLGTCVSFAASLPSGEHVGTVRLYGGTGISDEFALAAGDLKVIPAPEHEELEVEILPARRVDAGAGRGRRLKGLCRGGEVGIIIDARGRPLRPPEDPSERAAFVNNWRRSFEEAAQ